ncbi:hypothetical protein FOMA001_g345 [Fusarium oxysporum f. sp. matthiolae]|nr:hypothetical protein FOMA001_g345 [Fusarium oxysporum f. sp. matthiolae]
MEQELLQGAGPEKLAFQTPDYTQYGDLLPPAVRQITNLDGGRFTAGVTAAAV